jgi:hypothetical protein
MPPKKTNNATLAYVAKCNKCGKKHAPPLHEGCLQLALPLEDDQLDDPEHDGDPDNADLPDV